MLFKAVQLEDILEFPQFPAEIKSMLPGLPGSELGDLIRYSFSVSVDVDAAINLDALNLQVEVYKRKPPEPPVPKKIKNARLYAIRTKRLERDIIKARRIKESLRLANRSVDLSNYFSNDLANLKRANTVTSLSLLKPVTRSQKNSIAARSSIVSPPDPFTQNRSAAYKPRSTSVLRPVGARKRKTTNKPLSTTVVQGVKTAPVRSKPFAKIAISSKRDPASFSSFSQKTLSKTALSPVLKIQSSNLVFTPPRSLAPISVFRVTPRRKKVKFSLVIPRSKLANCSSFYVSLELENGKGVKVASTDTTVPHSMIFNSFLTPRRAPRIEAEYVKSGIVSVSVQPNPKDKMATRIKVFRRKGPPEEGATDSGSEWQEVFDSGIEDLMELRFRDVVASSSPLLYRAVSYGENAKPSEKFASTVVLPLKEFKVKQSGALTAIAEIVTKGNNSFVDVLVKDIPFDVVSVMVRRFNVNRSSDSDRKASKGAGFIYVGSSPALQQVFVRDIDDDGSAEFRDETSKPGNNYLYVPVGITKKGKEIVGSSAALEFPFSPNRAQVSMIVSSPRLTREGSVEMDLEGKFTDFGFSEVRRALSAGQQRTLFQTDLLEDREKFEPLINFLVERENMKTGELESFGVYEAGKFVDDFSVQREKNIKALEPGIEYSYTVTALLNSPESLFPGLVRSEIDQATLLSFSRKVAKYQRPLSLFRATLSSTSRQADVLKPSRLEPTDPLIAGRTNVQVRREFRFPVSKSSKPEIRVEMHKRFNRIVWLSDSVDNIDHFRVYVVSSGGKVLIDTVHCDASTSEFYYRHYKKDYAVSYQYMIQPIDLSYKELKPILTRTFRPVDMKRFLGVRSIKKIERI